MAMVLDGKGAAERTFKELKDRIISERASPKLSIVLCGENPESVLYTDLKKKKGEEIGMKVDIKKLPKSAQKEDVIGLIKSLNEKSDGIIIQLPLPENLKKNHQEILDAIDPQKDVDGLTSYSLGKVAAGDENFAPATPKGIIRLLEGYNLPIKGKHVVIINHSNLIGKPLAVMMLNRGATVTVCNEFTVNLKEHAKKADILISGTGKAGLVKSDMVKEGCIVVDVGVSKRGEKILGDVDFEEVKKKASYITPVPGGIGPMTVAMLLENVVNACRLK